MTKPKKSTYRIQYIDNTYQIMDWTKVEFKAVGSAMEEGKLAVMLDDGIFKLQDIRAIVYLPPQPELTEEELKLQREKEKALTEWGAYDQEVLDELKRMGIDVTHTEGVN